MSLLIENRPLEESQKSLPVVQRVYCARGVDPAEETERALTHLLPYDTLLGIHDAAELIASSVMAQQRILFVGDFDTDGATSSALGVSALRSFGATSVQALVPNRFKYNYGLTPEIVELASQQNPDLLITVDNGITSHDGVSKAQALGMKVVVTDHHLAGATLPEADVIVNPNQPEDPFPSKALAGVGVIFYVMLAVRAHLRDQGWFDEQKIPVPKMSPFLDLVALGTVADVVPLDRNNRLLVHHGWERIIRGQMRPGIAALFDIADKDPTTLVPSDMGFTIAPRLNAAGRIDDMAIGVACLLADDISIAKPIAHRLNKLNKERQKIEGDMCQTAFDIMSRLDQTTTAQKGICLYHQNWHQGVVGLVASRLKEKHHCPTIIFAQVGPQLLKGSARSISALNIRDFLQTLNDAHPQWRMGFGGHAMAAGVTLSKEYYEEFQQAFLEGLDSVLTPADLRHSFFVDGELPVEELTLETARVLREAGPWGSHFPEPQFVGDFVLVDQRLVGEKHLKVVLKNAKHEYSYDGIWFNIDLEKWPNHRANHVRIIYRLDINYYRGCQRMQFVIETMQAISK